MEIRPLTSLRGVFAIWVLLFHLQLWAPHPLGIALPLVSRGYLAVDFFFVLSGFILARAHAKEFADTPLLTAWGRFLAKRVARLFPLHWTMLAISVASLAAYGEPLPGLSHLFQEAALVHRWALWPVDWDSVNPPDWSISTEWAVNLAFPVIVVLANGRRALILAALSVTLLVVAYILEGYQLSLSSGATPLPLARCAGEFSIGVLLARWRPPAWMTRDGLIVLLMFGFFESVVLGQDLAAALILMAFVPAVAASGVFWSRLFSAPIPYWLGRVSYSIYLTQVQVIILMRHVAPLFGRWETPIYLAGSVVLVLGISWLTYTVVEVPGRRFMRRLLGSVRMKPSFAALP